MKLSNRLYLFLICITCVYGNTFAEKIYSIPFLTSDNKINQVFLQYDNNSNQHIYKLDQIKQLKTKQIYKRQLTNINKHIHLVTLDAIQDKVIKSVELKNIPTFNLQKPFYSLGMKYLTFSSWEKDKSSVYLYNLQNNTSRMVFESSHSHLCPSLSPDEKWIATYQIISSAQAPAPYTGVFTHFFHTQIVLYHIPSGEIQIYGDAGYLDLFEITPIVWDSSNKWIAYKSRINKHINVKTSDITIRNITTKKEVIIKDSDSPQWVSSSKVIACLNNQILTVLDIQNNQKLTIADKVQDYLWVGIGECFLFTDYDNHLYSVDTKGKQVRNIIMDKKILLKNTTELTN